MTKSTPPSPPHSATPPTIMDKLVKGDEVQDFTPGAIIKGTHQRHGRR